MKIFFPTRELRKKEWKEKQKYVIDKITLRQSNAMWKDTAWRQSCEKMQELDRMGKHNFGPVAAGV